MYKENHILKNFMFNLIVQGVAFWSVQIFLENWIAFRLWWVYATWLFGVITFTYFDIRRERKWASLKGQSRSS